jgi:hypothetical protein
MYNKLGGILFCWNKPGDDDDRTLSGTMPGASSADRVIPMACANHLVIMHVSCCRRFFVKGYTRDLSN